MISPNPLAIDTCAALLNTLPRLEDVVKARPCIAEEELSMIRVGQTFSTGTPS